LFSLEDKARSALIDRRSRSIIETPLVKIDGKVEIDSCSRKDGGGEGGEATRLESQSKHVSDKSSRTNCICRNFENKDPANLDIYFHKNPVLSTALVKIRRVFLKLT
jgi:hypothetical protein